MSARTAYELYYRVVLHTDRELDLCTRCRGMSGRVGYFVSESGRSLSLTLDAETTLAWEAAAEDVYEEVRRDARLLGVQKASRLGHSASITIYSAAGVPVDAFTCAPSCVTDSDLLSACLDAGRAEVDWARYWDEQRASGVAPAAIPVPATAIAARDRLRERAGACASGPRSCALLTLVARLGENQRALRALHHGSSAQNAIAVAGARIERELWQSCAKLWTEANRGGKS